MSIEAARNALARARIDPGELRAVWIGSESHPYAVKPSSTIVAEAIGAGPSIQAGDWEFACKAGTEAAGGRHGPGRLGHGRLRPGDRHGHRPGQARRPARIHRRLGRGGLHRRAGRRVPGGDPGLVLLRHRHARFLAARRAELPRARAAFHRRTGLLQAHHRGRQGPDGRDGHHARRLPLRRLPPAQHQVPAARRAAARVSPTSRSRPGCSRR